MRTETDALDFVAFDFETANEKWDSACAVGFAVVQGGNIVRTAHHLIRPAELRFSDWNTRIHGITESDVRDAPTLGELWPELWRMVEGRLMVAHSAYFDVGVLRRSLNANGCDSLPRFDFLCSKSVAEQAWPNLDSFGLSYLAAHHGLELNHHNAESDAIAAANLVLLAATQADCCGLRELASRLGTEIRNSQVESRRSNECAPTRRRSSVELELQIPTGYDVSNHPLHGKSIVFTGALSLCGRKQAEKAVESLGATPRSGVSKKVSYLVTGEQDIRVLANGETESSKLRKARELRAKGHPIEIMSESDFERILFTPIGVEAST